MSTTIPDPVDSAHSSALATFDHLRRLVHKRDTLVAAIAASFDALEVQITRVSWSEDDAFALWDEARSFDVPWTSKRIADAFGIPQASLQRWARYGVPNRERHLDFAWPITPEDDLPYKGAACVYVLLDDLNMPVYIGSSSQIRTRLKAHRKAARFPAERIHIYQCSSPDEAADLEGMLIFQHQPRYNIVGRARRVPV